MNTPPGVNIKEHASDSTLKLNSVTINDIIMFFEVYSVNFTFYNCNSQFLFNLNFFYKGVFKLLPDKS